MTRILLTFSIVCWIALSLSACVIRHLTESGLHKAVPTKGYAGLAELPFTEAWYGMYFQDDKVGYSHFKIEPSEENFSISSDSLMRLTAMKKTNEILMEEKVQVRPDLTLVSFESRVKMDGKDLRVVGIVRDGKLQVSTTVEGETRNRDYPLDGSLYHANAISLFPALRGLEEGKRYNFKVFNAEKQDLETVEQELGEIKGPAGPKGAVWSVKNTYGRSIIHSWLDSRGLTVLEKGLDGALITMLEDRSSAEEFLKKGAPQKDMVMDLSLIRVNRPIPKAEQVRFLRVRMSGIQPSLIASDHRQSVSTGTRGEAKDAFEVEIRAEDTPAANPSTRRPSTRAVSKGSDNDRSALPGDPVKDEHLAATASIQADHKEIVDRAARIVSVNDKPAEKVRKLVQWTSTNVENRMKDAFSALSVLRSREGECQAHAMLYVALARSQKIPSRMVTGLVYSNKIGFLYHAWAESHVNGWIAVDPTLNQIPADATHIKVATGETPDQASAILKMIGKVRMEVLDFR